MITTTENPFNEFENNLGLAFYNAQQSLLGSTAAVDVDTPRFPFYVRDRLPVHVLENHELYVKFIDGYFEWLGISNGINQIPYLMDIDNVSPALLIHHKELLAKLFPINQNYLWSDPANSEIDLRRFLTFIRQFYLTKGTEESIRFLLASLFGLEAASIDFDYPKLQLCFLSDSIWVPNIDGFDKDAAGVTYQGYWKDSRSTLSGGVRFRDKYFQEFSYSVTSVVPAGQGNLPGEDVAGGVDFNLNPIRQIAHPAGFRLFNNVGPDSYIPAAPGPIDTGYSEQPLVGHYLAYTFSTTIDPRQPFPDACSAKDWFTCGYNPYNTNPLTLGSVNCFTAVHDSGGYPIGWTAGTSGENGYTGPTYGADTYTTAAARGYTLWHVYHHPNVWSVGPTTGTAFGNMRLGWLMNLIPDAAKGYNVSPNDPLETLACSTPLATGQ